MAVVKGHTRVSDRTSTLQAGDMAPEIVLNDQDGNQFRLSDLRGKKNVVLAFYPAAFTPV